MTKREDAEDLKAVDDRKHEPSRSFEEALKSLMRRTK